MKNWIVNTLIVIGALVAIVLWSLLWYFLSKGVGLEDGLRTTLGFLWGMIGGWPIGMGVAALWKTKW